MKKINSVGIIGLGKLGESLADILFLKKKLSFLLIKNPKRLAEITKKYKLNDFDSPSVIQDIKDLPQSFDCLFLTTNDSSLMSVIDILSQSNVNFRNKFVVHCSGIFSSEIMSLLKEKGAITIAAHPYQTFFLPSEKNFENIYWTIDSCFGEKDLQPFINLIKSFKSKYSIFHFSSEEKKILYHLSAVLSSNFISLILFQAYEILKKAGLDNIDILKPIVHTSINNFFRTKGEMFPITGPAVRADIQSIKLHLLSIDDDYLLKEFYKSITKSIAFTAHRNNIISDKNLNDILEALIEDKVKK